MADRRTALTALLGIALCLSVDHSVGAATAMGSVRFPREHALQPGQRIRLISLVRPPSGAPLFIREVTSLDARPTLPAGKAIALLVDEKGRPVAVSRPMNVLAGAETMLWPDSPNRSERALAVRLKQAAATSADDRVHLTTSLIDGSSDRAPGAMVVGSDALFAVWYDVGAPAARLVVLSTDSRLPNDSVSLTRGSLTVVEDALLPLPTLTARIGALPADARAEPMSLSIADASNETVIRTMDVQAGKTYTFRALPTALLAVNLHVGEFEIERQVDLTSGNDTSITIPFTPLTVSGTVYQGNAPVRAQVRFLQRSHPISVDTDDRGNYAAVLWQPRRYIVETSISGSTLPPFTQNIAISSSQTLDIHVPSVSLAARVIDADSGKRIEGAQIIVHNRWADGSSVVTIPAKDAVTQLPPLRTGTVAVSAHAEGYADGEPIIVTVSDGETGGVIDVPLKRLAEAIDVEVRLDSGTPAAGAEIAAFSGDDVVWHGTAGDDGHVAVPATLAARRLLLRHPSAASEVTILGAGNANAVVLHAAAPPLIVRVVDRQSNAVAARVSLARGVRLSPSETAFVTWSLGSTPPGGTLILRGLAPQPIRLFATRKASAAQVQSGTFDPLAVAIPYPWPSIAIVPLADE